jgi:hypothetical protein
MVDQKLVKTLLKSGLSERQIRHVLTKRLGRPVSVVEVRQILEK